MCGLAAYVGNEYNTTLFKLVALAQDERGRDNAGFGYLSYYKEEPIFRSALGGIEPERLFTTCLERSYIRGASVHPAKTLAELLGDHTELPSNVPHWIFAHSRKATIGDSSAQNAQPFVKGDIMLMHNGTITNHQQIASTFGLKDYTSDSQLIALMVEAGYMKDIFQHFEGYCTCIWADIKDPEAYYVFCGSDKHYAASPPPPKKLLYYIQTPSGVYSSSNKRALEILTELIKEPGKKVQEVGIYKANNIYRVSADGIEKVEYISRRIQQASQQEQPSELPAPSEHLKLLMKDINSLENEPDVLQYVGGRYHLNGKVASTMWKIDKDGEISYFPLYVSKHTFLVYKKFKSGEYVTHMTEQRCAEKLENLVAVPILDGILLKTWQDFFDIVQDYGNVSLKKFVDASPLPVNIRLLLSDYPSIYFSGKSELVNSTLYIPFTMKRYQFSKSIVTDILNVSVTHATKMTDRYVKKLHKIAPAETPPEVAEAESIKRKFNITKNVMAKIKENLYATKQQRRAAKAVEKYLTEFFANEND